MVTFVVRTSLFLGPVNYALELTEFEQSIIDGGIKVEGAALRCVLRPLP
jgi:hypothetical protein